MTQTELVQREYVCDHCGRSQLVKGGDHYQTPENWKEVQPQNGPARHYCSMCVGEGRMDELAVSVAYGERRAELRGQFRGVLEGMAVNPDGSVELVIDRLLAFVRQNDDQLAARGIGYPVPGSDGTDSAGALAAKEGGAA